MSFDGDLARLDALADALGKPCGCPRFCILIDGEPEPRPCPAHGWKGSYRLRIHLAEPSRQVVAGGSA